MYSQPHLTVRNSDWNIWPTLKKYLLNKKKKIKSFSTSIMEEKKGNKWNYNRLSHTISSLSCLGITANPTNNDIVSCPSKIKRYSSPHFSSLSIHPFRSWYSSLPMTVVPRAIINSQSLLKVSAEQVNKLRITRKCYSTLQFNSITAVTRAFPQEFGHVNIRNIIDS